MLRSVQRLERRGGFRPRLYDSRSRREYLEYQAIARIQGSEEPGPHGRGAFGEVQGQGRRAAYEVYEVQDDPHDRLERLLRRAVSGAGEGPE